MKIGTAFKNLPTGTKAVLAWSVVYTVIAVVTCIYFWDVQATGYAGILPNLAVGVTYAERAVFYIVLFGGWIAYFIIKCRVRVCIEETDGYSWKREWKLSWKYDLPIIIAMVIAMALCWNRIIGSLIVCWFFTLSIVEDLWKFRRELGLVQEE